MPASHAQVKALIFEGLIRRDHMSPATASACAETILQDYERSRICANCGNRIDDRATRRNSRHLLHDPISLRETDH